MTSVIQAIALKQPTEGAVANVSRAGQKLDEYVARQLPPVDVELLVARVASAWD